MKKDSVDKSALRKAKGIVTVEPGLNGPIDMGDKITQDILTITPQLKEEIYIKRQSSDDVSINNESFNNKSSNSNSSQAENDNASYKSVSSSLLKKKGGDGGGFLSRLRGSTVNRASSSSTTTMVSKYNNDQNHNNSDVNNNTYDDDGTNDNDNNSCRNRDSTVSEERLLYEANDLRDKIRNKTYELMNVNTMLNNKITLLQENINAQIKLPVTVNYNTRIKSKHQLHASILTDDISNLTQDKSALEEMIANYKDLYQQLTSETYDDFIHGSSSGGSSSRSSSSGSSSISSTKGLFGRWRNSLSSKQIDDQHCRDRRHHSNDDDDKNGHDDEDHSSSSKGNSATVCVSSLTTHVSTNMIIHQ